jgi:hypothetical protein
MAIEAFRRSPERRHIAVTATVADYILLLREEMPDAFLEWGIGQARCAVMAIAVCRRHDDGSITRRLTPVFPRNLKALATDLAIGEQQASLIFEDLGRWSACYSGNIPSDLMKAE